MKNVFKITGGIFLKTLKGIGIAILILLALIILFLVFMAFKKAVPANYTKKTETGGPIEAAYLADGKYEVRKKTYKAEGDMKKYTIYYPEEMENSDTSWPSVIMVNGTGIPASKYEASFHHLASWGFIVVGNEYPSTGFGTSTDETLEFMKDINENDPLFTNRFDFNRIGLEGHSQGGAGCFTELSNSPYKDSFKTAVVLSPTGEEMAYALGWKYDVSKAEVPVLMLAANENDVIDLPTMTRMYERMTCPKVMAFRKEDNHGNMLYKADGYATAWLMWQLQEDAQAGKAFIGDAPELLSNPLYQDQKADLSRQ